VLLLESPKRYVIKIGIYIIEVISTLDGFVKLLSEKLHLLPYYKPIRISVFDSESGERMS